MNFIDPLLTRRATIMFVTVLTVVRGFLAARLQLHPDEAYYWLWSRHLDAGYFDHPPLIAYVIRLTTVFSQSEFWVRFAGIAGAVVMSVLVWKLARRMFDNEKICAASVVVFNTLPLTMSGTLIMTPDIPAFFFWALAVFFAWEVARTQRPVYWYLTGIAFGLALLSKYTALLFAPCLLLFLLTTDERGWLKTIHPYAAFALGCLFFLPVVYWNSRHEWISFAFQMGHGLAGAKPPNLFNIVEYAGGQLLVAGPVIWLAGMAAGWAYRRRGDKAAFFLNCMSLPIILFFAASSWRSLSGPNWPAFAYFTFSVLASRYLMSGTPWRRIVGAGGVAFNVLLTGVVLAHAAFSVFPLARWNPAWAEADPTKYFHGWRELGAFIERHPDIRYAVTLSHQYSPEITYYTHEKVLGWIDPRRTRVSQYDYWKFPDALRDEAGVYVAVEGGPQGPYQDYFSAVGDKTTLTVMRAGAVLRKYILVPGRGLTLPDRRTVLDAVPSAPEVAHPY